MSPVRVRRAVEAALPGWFGDDVSLRWPDGPVRHTWSCQFRPQVVRPDGTVTDLVVKIPLWTEAPDLPSALAAGPQEDTKAEAAILEAIEAEIEGPGLGSVKVRGYLPEVNAIVMDRFDGRPIRALVSDPRQWARLPAVLERTGRWLRAYHDRVAGGAVEPFAVGALSAELELAFVMVPESSEAVVRIRCALQRLEGRPARIAATHGDFTLANVLVSDDGDVAGIDPNRYEAPVLSDLARLIVDLRTHRMRAASFGMLPPKRLVTEWEAAVRSGYGEADEALLSVLIAIAALERLRDANTTSVGPARRMAAPLVRRLLLSELERAACSVRRAARP